MSNTQNNNSASAPTDPPPPYDPTAPPPYETQTAELPKYQPPQRSSVGNTTFSTDMPPTTNGVGVTIDTPNQYTSVSVSDPGSTEGKST